MFTLSLFCLLPSLCLFLFITVRRHFCPHPPTAISVFVHEPPSFTTTVINLVHHIRHHRLRFHPWQPSPLSPSTTVSILVHDHHLLLLLCHLLKERERRNSLFAMRLWYWEKNNLKIVVYWKNNFLESGTLDNFL